MDYLSFRADGSCRHVAACLFDIDHTVRTNQEKTCTSKECSWKRQGKPNENACAISELKICKSEYGKRERQTLKPTNFEPRSLKHDPADFLDSLRQGLNDINSSSVILKVLPPPEPVVIDEVELTKIISSDEIVMNTEEVAAEEIYTIIETKEQFLQSKGIDSISLEDITQEICREFREFISITPNQALMISDKTIGQGTTDFWFNQRQGRLTGSNFYRLCHLKETTNNDNTIQDLLGYCPIPPEKLPYQFEWGHEKEGSALNLYIKKMKKKHKHLSVSDSGLVINPTWPYIGASPDGYRFCKCCGKVVLEVKSLYSKRSLPPYVAAQEYLYTDQDGKTQLKKKTRWYYQIQGELAVTKLKCADLIIYTNKGILVIPVKFDSELWQSILRKLEEFYDAAMIPELLTQQLKEKLMFK